MKEIKIAYVTLQYTQDAPPLGLASIATYLRKYGGFKEQKIIDVPDKDRIKATLDYNPDVVLISANTMHYPKAIEFAAQIKQRKNIPVIIGGVHISTMPKAMHPVFDIGVIGEGEQTTLELLELFRNKGNFIDKDTIKGIAYWSEHQLEFTPAMEFIKPLDKIPFPDRSFLDNRYFNKKSIIHTNKAKRITGIITSRGCPYKCIFCSTSFLWKELRMHSAEHIADEIEYLIKEYRTQAFFVYDDIFTINKPRLKELIGILKQRDLLGKFSMNCMGRSDTIDSEVLLLLQQLNCDYINFGFESGSDRILHKLKGGHITVEHHKKAIKLCKMFGIKVCGSLMFGNPGEKMKDLQKTLELIDFMYDNGVSLVWSTITKPFPGTPMWDDLIAAGRITEDIDPAKLSEMNIDPICKDGDVLYQDFMYMFEKGRAKIRKMEFRFWKDKFIHDPVHSIMFAMPKLLRFFSLQRGEA